MTKSQNAKSYRVAVVGATGNVGQAMMSRLKRSNLPTSEIVPFASAASAGRELTGGGTVRELSPQTISGFDLALLSAGSSVSLEWAPKFVEQGATVVDNSSAWRRDDRVPLVVSEVNPETLDAHHGIIANPNCQTMQMVVVLAPLLRTAGIERVIVSTYQSASGTGRKAVEELARQSQRFFADRTIADSEVYPHQLAGNILPVCGGFSDGDDYTDEERKMIFESRKILGVDDLAVSPFCARVPVPNCHSESLNIQTVEKISAQECRNLLTHTPGITVIDSPEKQRYPIALHAAGKEGVFVGRIRDDPSHLRALNLWIVADNLLKGAASNAVEIAELLDQQNLIAARQTLAWTTV